MTEDYKKGNLAESGGRLTKAVKLMEIRSQKKLSLDLQDVAKQGITWRDCFTGGKVDKRLGMYWCAYDTKCISVLQRMSADLAAVSQVCCVCFQNGVAIVRPPGHHAEKDQAM